MNQNHHIHNPQGTIRQIKTKSRRRRDGLIKYAYSNTSQSGEDGIIEYLFRKIPPPNNKKNENNGFRWLVDVGAWDGIHLSNTYSLLMPSTSDGTSYGSAAVAVADADATASAFTQQWKGILIEADPEKFKQLSTLYSNRTNDSSNGRGNICHNITVSCQPWSKSSLAHILKSSSSLPTNFDFLCIDVDGTDYWLLHNILHDTNLRPNVICIEFNPTIPHSVLFIPPRNDQIRHGCSLTALIDLTSTFDYQLVETTCYNAFFVQNTVFDLYIKSDIPFTPSIENLHEITMGTNLYQLYDGTIKLAGCQKLLWHRIPIQEEQIQVIKKKERNFPFAPADGTINNNDYGQCINSNEKNVIDVDLQNLAIDMSSYCLKKLSASTDDVKSICSSAIFEQLQKDGFALVRGTGIPTQICQTALKYTNLLLNDASEKVRRSCLTKDRARRGYSPPNSENFASLIGEKKSNDLVRKFRVGPAPCFGGSRSTVNQDDDTDTLSSSITTTTTNNTTTTAVSSALHQPNAWPTAETWGEENATKFQSSIETYYNHLCQVANSILNAICDGINNHCHNSNISLPSSLLNNGCDAISSDDNQQSLATKNTSILTLLGYRKGARHQGKHPTPLVAAHTDVGVITVLLFDGGDCAKLQRCRMQSQSDKNNEGGGSWVDVKLPDIVPDDPIFVVNIGDCLSDMCDGALPSTLHRVMPNKGGTKERNCLALFMGLHHNEMLHLSNGEDITYEEWRRRRIVRAQEALVSIK